MIPHRTLERAARTAIRAGSVGLIGSLLLIGGPALADDPRTWQTDPPVTGLDFLIVLLLIPVGLVIVITALVVLTTKNNAYRPGEAWIGKSEWFGGPGKGAGASTPAIEGGEQSTGGASAEF